MILTVCMQAVVRPHGGHAVVLNWSMFTVYGVNKHEVSLTLVCFHTLFLSLAICSKLFNSSLWVQLLYARVKCMLNNCLEWDK